MWFSTGRSRNSIKSKMELFPTIENDFCFDATSDLLKKFCSFGLLFAQMGFGLIMRMVKISNQIGDGWYVSVTSQMDHSALGSWWYVSSTYQR